MKYNFAFYYIFFCLSTAIHAQNFQIGFSGSGASSTVDSVNVENLTQCTSMLIGGNDILQLVAQVGITEVNDGSGNSLLVYPNPGQGMITADIDLIAAGNVSIELSDMAGKSLQKLSEHMLSGRNQYYVSGLEKGIYVLKFWSESFSESTEIISISDGSGGIKIMRNESVPGETITQTACEKTTEKSLIQMQYNNGDLLKLTGKSSAYRTVFMLVPVSSQTVTFNFVPCTDTDGHNYTVVKIGNQWWMAENLNAGTYVPVTTPQVSGTKFCMDVNGQADPNCPMGGLYEWANLLQGDAPCNGTGAPPNDECVTPVKGLCPNGWHIPSHYEWTTLERNAGSNPSAFPYDMSTISLLGTDEGGNMKETCTTYWWAPNAGATNLTGFGGLPGGDTWQGVFEDFGQSGYFWTSSETFYMAWVHALNYSLSVIGRSSYAVESGFSCRCVKD